MLAPAARERSVYRYWVQLESLGRTQPAPASPSAPPVSKSYAESATTVILDTGSSLSYLPDNVVTALAADLDAHYNDSLGMYLMSCHGLTGTVDFSFGPGSATFRIPVADFVWDVDGTGRRCVMGVAPADPSLGVAGLLGDTFLRSVYTVFDQDSNAVFLAPYTDCGRNEVALPATSDAVANLTGECPAPEIDMGTSKSDSSGSTNSSSGSGGSSMRGSSWEWSGAVGGGAGLWALTVCWYLVMGWL